MRRRDCGAKAVCVIAASLAILPGCVSRPGGANTPTQQTPKPVGARYIVYLLDVTGSYALVDQAFDQAAAEVTRNTRAGDVWFFRVINRESYSDRGAIVTLRCPAPTTEKINPFDRAAKARARARMRAFQDLKSSAAAQIRAYKVPHVEGTDVYGALAKAGDILGGAPEGAETILVLSTDFGDTERRTATANLHGAKVYVAAFQSGGDPKKAQAVRQAWEQRLKKYGAASVTFPDASEGAAASPLGG